MVWLKSTAGSGLQPEPSGLLNTDVCANDVISKDITTGVQVANLNPQKGAPIESLGVIRETMPVALRVNVLRTNDFNVYILCDLCVSAVNRK